MNWTLKEIKQKGNEAVQYNYWKTCFMTALALSLSFGTVYSALIDFIQEFPTAVKDIYENISRMGNHINLQVAAVIITLAVGLLLLSLIFKLVFNVFIKNPVDVGICVFMKDAMTEDKQPMISSVGYTFDNRYLYTVRCMLIVHLTEFFFMLLFFIPGVIKQYEYRMVPYIISDYQDLTAKEVMQLSHDMMYGNKWKAFLLDLSFLPWHLAGIMSLGLLDVFYVLPYQKLTETALYHKLKLDYEEKQKEATGTTM